LLLPLRDRGKEAVELIRPNRVRARLEALLKANAAPAQYPLLDVQHVAIVKAPTRLAPDKLHRKSLGERAVGEIVASTVTSAHPAYLQHQDVDGASEKASGRRLFVHVTLGPARVVEICRKKNLTPRSRALRLRPTREQISD